MVIEEPIEWLELRDKETAEFHVERYEWGEYTISPRYAGAPARKAIPVLRVYVPAEDKPRFPHYWDISSKRVHAQLRAPLDMIVRDRMLVRITATGVRPAKWFQVEWIPE